MGSLQKFKIGIGIIIFLLLGLFTRFYHLSEPKSVVFDEFHFFHFVVEYEKGNYFFDIHPPLGKLILWGNAKMYGLEEYIADIKKQEQNKKDIEAAMKQVKTKYLETNDPLEKQKYELLESKKKELDAKKIESYDIGSSYSQTLNMFGIRSIPAFFGALLVPLMFLFSWVLTRNYAIAILVGGVTAFDSALITESQYVLMDSILIFFMVASVFFTVLYAQQPSWKWWMWVCVFSSLAVSIKWTGATVIAAAGVVWIWKMIEQKSWITSLWQGVAYWTLMATVYIMSFWVHFALLPHSGEGDAFHTPEFRKNLESSLEYENPSITPMMFWGRFLELNVQMGERSAAIRNEHPFASRPTDWIKGEKSIYYWAGPQNKEPSGLVERMWNQTLGMLFMKAKQCTLHSTHFSQQIHLFPNPIAWKIFFGSMILSILILFWEGIRWWKTKQYSKNTLKIAGLLGLSIINIAPFMMIERPQFLYHALEWALFSLLLLGSVLHYALRPFSAWALWALVGILLGGAFGFFLIELPLIYGFSFPDCVGSILFDGF